MFTVQKCCDLAGIKVGLPVERAKNLRRHLDTLVENHLDEIKQMVTPADVPYALDSLKKSTVYYLVGMVAMNYILKSVKGESYEATDQHEDFCADLRLVLSGIASSDYEGMYDRYCHQSPDVRDKGFENYLKLLEIPMGRVARSKVAEKVHVQGRER